MPNAGTTEKYQNKDGYIPENACDEQLIMSVKSGILTVDRDEKTLSELAEISSGNSKATEKLDKGQSVPEGQASQSRDEVIKPDPGDRVDSEPESVFHKNSGANEDSKESNVDSFPQSAETVNTTVVEVIEHLHAEQTPGDVACPDEKMGATGIVVAVDATFTSDYEQPTELAAEDEGDGSDLDQPTVGKPTRKKRPRKMTPKKYRGLSGAIPQFSDARPQPGSLGGEISSRRERSLSIQVRLRFGRGGCCIVSLIARRSTELLEDLTVIAGASEVNLRAMQDEWYQDFIPDNLSSVLQNGTVWIQEGASGQCTWSLSGRELYVLAGQTNISGYVSQPYLDLGREHVVLCTKAVRSRVEEAIRETGAQPTAILDESFGVPSGWIVFRGIVPIKPVPPVNNIDIFNALRPPPQITINLERGIRLEGSKWLEEHPPLIRVYGEPEHTANVLIDNQPAECLADGAYRAPGWDAIGLHTVRCAGKSRTYSIVPFKASWRLWDAYKFPVVLGGTKRLAICGPLVREATDAPWDSELVSVSVPETNPVLLGPEPGQIVMAMKASPLRGAPCIASPSFPPIWALPDDPLHCDKKTIRVLFLAGKEMLAPKKRQAAAQNSGTDADVVRWYQLILNANRKGLTTDPDVEPVRALWLSYKSLALRIWRSRK